MKRVLFLGMHRKGRAPSQRFRFEQYLGNLRQHGYQCDYSTLISEKDDPFYHGSGQVFRKLLIGVKAVLIRLRDVLRMNRYDIIFISRRAFLTESMVFERILRLSRAKLIFDIDDAIWIDAVSHFNRRFAWLKGRSNTANIVRMVDLVFAGNQYIADFARKYNDAVVIVPTTIDTSTYVPPTRIAPRHDYVVVGWSGSWSTLQHFKLAIPALRRLKQKYGDGIRFKVIGDKNYRDEELDIRGIAWTENTEVADLAEIDIGIMPLPDDQWSWGKCGLKGLQYMALGIPTVMSPVGVNREIITHEINGFLCSTGDEWVEALSRLIEDADLRQTLGMAGRRTVIERYSIDAWKATYLQHFGKLST